MTSKAVKLERKAMRQAARLERRTEREKEKAQRRAAIRDHCDRWQVPATVAVLVLAGILPEAQLAGHAQRETWQAEYAGEQTVYQAPGEGKHQALRRRQAERLAQELGIEVDFVFTVLTGAVEPRALLVRQQKVERARARMQHTAEQTAQADETARSRDAARAQAAQALRAVGVPNDLAHCLAAACPAGSPPAVALEAWNRTVRESGFATDAELLEAWQRHRVLSVAGLRQALADAALRFHGVVIRPDLVGGLTVVRARRKPPGFSPRG